MIEVSSVVGGLALLVLGADQLVRSAAALAVRLGVPRSTVGLTVVSWGTSFPELVVSVDASLRGFPDIAIGNVVGSNIYNLALILGLTALIRPVLIAGETRRVDAPLMAISALLAAGATMDGRIAAWEGGLLLAAMVGVTALLARRRGAAPDEGAPADPPGSSSLVASASISVVSIVLLGVGARLFVDGAVAVATDLRIDERVIGLTLVALGTSLPELFTSVAAAIRREDDIAVSNVVGSNIFNVLGILGTASLVLPLSVSDGMADSDVWWMVGLTLFALGLLWLRPRLGRPGGLALLVVGSVYTANLLGSDAPIVGP